MLMLAIVQPDDVDAALRSLVAAGLRATRISSLGGFLRLGNVTLLLGLDDHEVARATQILRTTCQTRRVFVNAASHPTEAGYHYMAAPLEAEVGGATIFTIPVERTVRIGAQREATSNVTHSSGGANMKLLLAIVSDEMSSKIVQALTDEGFRATVISTAGGFLRKGNATLLIGVEAAKAERALKLIEQTCATAKGKPEHATATVFVLAAEQYERV